MDNRIQNCDYHTRHSSMQEVVHFGRVEMKMGMSPGMRRISEMNASWRC